jgi:DNA-directed RNA polymerase specialized sigma24 family protein
MDKDEKKRAIYDRLSSRRKKFIDKIGYENWDPFQEPNHPIEIRREATQRTTQQLVQDFLNQLPAKDHSSAYSRGVAEFCMGIMGKDERYKGMYDFCLWYHEQLKKYDKEDEAWK